MRVNLPTLLALCSVMLPGCGPSPTRASYAGEDFTDSFMQADFNRYYHVHVPERPDPGPVAPLVLAFHGVGQTGNDLREHTALDETADRYGFIVVYMEAAMGAWDVFGGLASLGLDEQAYVREVIDRVSRRVVVDPRRIIAIGFSNGGVMAQQLGCRQSHQVAGFVSIAATMPKLMAEQCHPDQSVSALYLVGTADPQFSVEGSSVLLSVDGTLDVWRRANRCDGGRDRTAWPDEYDDGTRVYWSRYSGCENGARVWLDSIAGGGHTWPGRNAPASELNGLTSRDIDANLEIVRFLDGLRRD